MNTQQQTLQTSTVEGPTLFGLTQEEFSDWSLSILLTGLILYMIFIIGNLAYKSKAGKYGALWLFLALGLGFVGFVSKALIKKILGIE